MMRTMFIWYQRFIGFLLIAGPASARAAIIDTPPNLIKNNTKLNTVPAIIQTGFDTVILVAGIVFVVLILIGGVMYMSALGNDDQSKKAKQLIFDAVIGLVIVVTAWAVGNKVLDLLGLGGLKLSA